MRYRFAVVEDETEILLREGAAGGLAGRVLDVVGLVQDDDVGAQADAHRGTDPRLHQVIVRAEDDVRRLHQIPLRPFKARPLMEVSFFYEAVRRRHSTSKFDATNF